ncbi:permease [Nocardia sp. CDC186]|uniref:Permease n=1 Tax=Nocardia implantans TaxID=3108168 RepID=A0ABU6B1Z3_9NOCA|nr:MULTISPECIES: permease [unclassified Nocardia]MBF6195642.1 permease [Nocardia beijingensis]MEA3531272.1 permease [Nocardia sp. CDC192]MEB3513518.1 permease [Nocardia sp. CDC186]
MTSTEGQPVERKSTASAWRTRIIGGAALVAVLVVLYFILSAFIPRWWAQRVGSMVHGSFAKGIGWGLCYGGLFTILTLFLLLFAVLVWRRKGGRFAAGAAVVVAILFALPSLMTLTIVLGNSSAAHAGERILDVDAPAFRGAMLTGAVIATLLFLLAVALWLLRRWRRTHPGTPETEDTTSRPV